MARSEVARVGWDIGGAHVKVAAIDGRGRVVVAAQVPSPLWRGLEQLREALGHALSLLPASVADAPHAATMTGELADLFADREQGVRQIVRTLQPRIGARHLSVYAGARGFVDAERALECTDHVASANWMATAQWIAGKLGNALLVDIGSTTTDLVAVRDGKVRASGHSDFERLVSGELVYTGVVRTALMSIADAIEFEGLRVPLMAELFATTADVYRITGELDEASDQHAPADGSEKTVAASARRLARMVGCDARQRPHESWEALARSFRGAQTERMRRCAQQVLLRGELSPDAQVVAAGSGSFLVPELAQDLRQPCIAVARLMESSLEPIALARCAPAIAVAALAQQNGV